MHRVIRKRIRHQAEGIDLAIDFNADVMVNVSSTEHDAPGEESVPEEPAAPEGNEEGNDR